MTNRNLHDDQIRAEFADLVAAITKDFSPHPRHRRYRIPARATPLDPLCSFLGVDVANDPHEFSRTLFAMEWDSLPGDSSIWQLHALRLPSGERAYWVDDLDGRRIVAVGPGGVGADGRFARVLFDANGQGFGTGVLDSLPSRVRTSLRGEQIIDLFVAAIRRSANAAEGLPCFSRGDVRRWLKEVLAKGGKELRPPLSRDQLLREFLAGVQGLVSDFTRHPQQPGVKVPTDFTPLYPVAKSLGKTLDSLLRSVGYQLFQFAWWSVPGSTCIQQIGAILLPGGARVFWFYLEADDDRTRQYFIAGTATAAVDDYRFLQLLFAENGRAFGVEVCGCPPCEIITPLKNHPGLPDLFVAAYNGFPQAWDSLRWSLSDCDGLDRHVPEEARELVERHLAAVVDGRHRPTRATGRDDGAQERLF